MMFESGCKNCRWWDRGYRLPSGDWTDSDAFERPIKTGICRVNPPNPDWPKTYENDYCRYRNADELKDPYK